MRGSFAKLCVIQRKQTNKQKHYLVNCRKTKLLDDELNLKKFCCFYTNLQSKTKGDMNVSTTINSKAFVMFYHCDATTG